LRAQACGEKQHQLLLLCWRQRFRRRLNFIEFAHANKLSRNKEGDNHPIERRV
jgi:hypothetical protein